MRIWNYQFDPVKAEQVAWMVGTALVILLIAWIATKAVKWVFGMAVEKVEVFQRSTGSGETIGKEVGNILSLVIWLGALVAILSVFNFGDATAPLQVLLDNIVAFVPKLVVAALIFFIGLMVAKLVRDLVVTTLQALHFDRLVNKGGVDSVTGNTALSKTIGTICYILVIIPIAIAALSELQLQSVSEPASEMLNLLLASVPRIIGAAILLGIGFLISRFVVQVLEEILPGLGVDSAFSSTHMLPEGASASKAIARVSQIAIILFFAIAATRLLGFPELTAILDQILELGGRVIFGAAVILVGFLIANLLAKLLSGSGETTLAATVVRWATILLSTFMGLRFMEVGEEIIEMAFGAFAVGGALAGALAFGLGGREAAGKFLEDLRNRRS